MGHEKIAAEISWLLYFVEQNVSFDGFQLCLWLFIFYLTYTLKYLRSTNVDDR